MEGIAYLFILVLVFLFLVILPLWISIKLYRYLRKKGFGWKIRIISFVPILTAFVLIYFSFYPSDSHYKDIYRQVTKNSFPEDAQFISKYSADPTFIEGWTLMMIKLNRKQYSTLKSQLKDLNYKIETRNNKKVLRKEFDVKDFFELRRNLQVDCVLYTRPEQYVYYGVAFMNDGETIIIKKII